jgi:hypothetical protein
VKLAPLLALALAACGTPPPVWDQVDGGACQLYEVPATLDLTSPVRSFTADVLPILTSRCGNACHGTSAPAGNLTLAGSASAVHGALVGKPSGELGAMSFVATGDPTRSFMMHKLDGDQCVYDTTCAGGSCQQPMPMSGGGLSPAQRDTIRQWIYQGAALN